MTKTSGGARAWRTLLCIVCAWSFSNVAVVPRALAQDSSSATAVAKAKKLFAQGSALYLAGQYGQALELLTNSYNLVPSPNSELVIARCLRDLGRLVEAQASFASAEQEARRRAGQGAPKYAQTADSAAVEGAAVRSSLGTVRIRVEDDPDAKLDLDGVAVDAPSGKDAVVWHPPGDATISVHSSSGSEQQRLVTVRAGAEVTAVFSHPAPPPPEERPPAAGVAPEPAPDAPRRPVERTPDAPVASRGALWARPAAFSSGAVALVGAGMFAGFGVAADSTYKSLKNQCPTGCVATATLKSEAQAGNTYKDVANVSLVVGSVAVVATLVFAVISMSSPPRVKTNSSVGWHLFAGSTTTGIEATFR